MAQVSGIEIAIKADGSGLEKGLNRAQGAIERFSKSAMAGLAGALSAGAFVAAGKAAINYADSIGKMSQRVGMTTEELSRLNYVAKLSDVSLSELKVGIQQLSKNMEAGSDGLAALGISATDSAGNLRSTNEVMMDVADAFSGMEDGAGKTAIAMNIFGRSGAQLITMLNAGRNGLSSMAREAERLGVVISQDTAMDAATFNDNMTRLSEVMSGLTQSVIAPLLPKLIDLSDILLDLIKNSNFTSKAVDGMDWVLRNIAKTAATTYKEFYALSQLWGVLMENLANPTSIQGAADRWRTAFENIRTQAAETEKTIARLSGAFSASPDDIERMLGSIDGFQQGQKKAQAPRLPGVGATDKAASGRELGLYREEDPFFIDRLAMIKEQFATERELLAEEFALNQQTLDGALANKLLSEQEYYNLSTKLAEDHQAALAAIQQTRLDNDLSAASDFFGAMAQIAQVGGKKTTKIAKVFGIAQALISTFQGAAKALTLPFPANLAAYATTLAQGMSAVAAIKGVSEGGGGGGGASRGRRGSGMAAGSASAAPAAASPTTTFSFTLMNDPMGFGEKFARQFIDQLNSTQRNGGTIRGVIA